MKTSTMLKSAVAAGAFAVAGVATANADTITVQAGDTLFRIAKNNRLTLSELKALNGLTSNNIRVGQVLKVSK